MQIIIWRINAINLQKNAEKTAIGMKMCNPWQKVLQLFSFLHVDCSFAAHLWHFHLNEPKVSSNFKQRQKEFSPLLTRFVWSGNVTYVSIYVSFFLRSHFSSSIDHNLGLVTHFRLMQKCFWSCEAILHSYAPNATFNPLWTIAK